MNQGFLYRRLARLIPCVIQHLGTGSLAIRNKTQIASLRDVFLSSHYWRLSEHLSFSPKTVLDLGAHCGHFTILLHLIALEKFGEDSSRYLLVEPIAELAREAARSLREVGIGEQTEIFNGLVGRRFGSGRVSANPRNYLAATAVNVDPTQDRSHQFDMAYIDLESIVPSQTPVDVLKIDIEGSEYDLLETYPDLIRKARLVVAELHGEPTMQDAFESKLAALGQIPISKPIQRGSERMILYGSQAA